MKGCDPIVSKDRSQVSPRRPRRLRFRGAFAGRRGRQAGLTALVLPLTGYVIRDLRKPDSVIRAIARSAHAWLTERAANRRRQVGFVAPNEIDEAIIVEDTDSQESLLKKEDSNARRR
jgi:hypothetical protein